MNNDEPKLGHASFYPNPDKQYFAKAMGDATTDKAVFSGPAFPCGHEAALSAQAAEIGSLRLEVEGLRNQRDSAQRSSMETKDQLAAQAAELARLMDTLKVAEDALGEMERWLKQLDLYHPKVGSALAQIREARKP